MKNIILTITLLLIFCATSFAFDGQRKGFVLGGGLGYTPTAEFSVDGFSGTLSNSGVGLNLLAGYAWDEFNMIVYEGNVSGYSINSVDITQGFNGASWYHYFGNSDKSFFSVIGLGFYVFSVDEYDADPGGGVLLGGGYEFSKHWQVAAYFSSGKTSENTFLGKIDYEHTHFSILLSGIAF